MAHALRPLTCLLFAALVAAATAALAETPAPGNMQLLPGYQHKALQGIDSRPGVIEKQGGLKIHYDIGAVIPPGGLALGGSFSDRPKAVPKNQRQWYKEQVIAGQPVHLAYTKQNVLMVAYPESGINLSVTAKSTEEVTDALLMILSYRAEKKGK